MSLCRLELIAFSFPFALDTCDFDSVSLFESCGINGPARDGCGIETPHSQSLPGPR